MLIVITIRIITYKYGAIPDAVSTGMENKMVLSDHNFIEVSRINAEMEPTTGNDFLSNTAAAENTVLEEKETLLAQNEKRY